MAPTTRYTGAEYLIGEIEGTPAYFDLIDLDMLTDTDTDAYDMRAQCLNVDNDEGFYSCFCTQDAVDLVAADDVACLNIFYFNITDASDSTQGTTKEYYHNSFC